MKETGLAGPSKKDSGELYNKMARVGNYFKTSQVIITKSGKVCASNQTGRNYSSYNSVAAKVTVNLTVYM